LSRIQCPIHNTSKVYYSDGDLLLYNDTEIALFHLNRTLKRVKLWILYEDNLNELQEMEISWYVVLHILY
jgi:hypothetical protein